MKPTNPLVCAILTDKYQLTMAYAYWKTGIHEVEAVFNLFFRKCPLDLEFALFVGLDEALRFVKTFGFTESDIEYIKGEMPDYCEPEFFDWLAGLNASEIRINAFSEGTIAFPQEPLMEVRGPLAVAQLLETTLLNQVGFASIDATNAAKYRLFVGPDKKLVEFGLRRGQGADGALTAARSSYAGGFNGTSNVLAGKLHGIPIFGTMAHSYITAFSGVEVDKTKWRLFDKKKEKKRNFWVAVSNYRHLLATRIGTSELGFWDINMSELVAFAAYAYAFPNSFLTLVDTYSTLQSGVLSYICVALALIEFGYQPIGIRLDSGNLATLSKKSRKRFETVAVAFPEFSEGLLKSSIFASDGINHKKLQKIYKVGHAIDTFCIGTNQATCEEQPALGVVYKLVMIAGKPCIKKSDDDAKTILPGAQKVYRLWGKEGPIADIIMLEGESEPKINEEVQIHLSDGVLTVWPTQVDWLNLPQWPDIQPLSDKPDLTIHDIRRRVMQWLAEFPQKHLDLKAPVKYPVGVSLKLKRLQAKLLAKNC